MMNDLPTGWVVSPIGSLCTLFNGRAFKPSDWTDKGLPIVRIQNLNNPNASFNYYDKEVDERFLLNGGELLFAWSGTPGTSFGAHIWRGEKAVLNQHIFRVDFDETSIDKSFFRYAINQKLNELIGVAHGGVGLRHVTKGVFENTEIVVPPYNEQKRIAKKLDSLLTRVDSCQSHLERVPQILKRFRQSVLAAATSGRLTEDWREARGINLDDWESKNLGELVLESANGFSKRRSDSGKETVVLRLADFKNAERFIGNERTVKMSEKELQKYGMADGDLLVIRVNGSRDLAGRFIEYKNPGETAEAYCDHFIRLRLDTTKILSRFASYVANSGEGRRYIELELVTSAGQNTINQPSVFGLMIYVPSLEEQAEIVRRVESLFAYAERLEARYQSASEHVERLTPSLLAKAFRGEL